MTKRCSNCRWFQAMTKKASDRFTTGNSNTSAGNCRIYPPHYRTGMADCFPVVFGDSLCGVHLLPEGEEQR